MLDNILNTIDEKAKQEIDKILKQKKETIFALESEHQKELAQKQDKEKEDFSKKIQAEIEEARIKKLLEDSFSLQRERNKIVETTYKASEDKIAKLSDKEFGKIIKGFLRHIPNGLEGSISAGERTANVLEIEPSVEYPVKNDLKEEGFLFYSKALEIDLRISQALKQDREETCPEVIKILFNS